MLGRDLLNSLTTISEPNLTYFTSLLMYEFNREQVAVMDSDRRRSKRVSVNLEAKFFGGAERGRARISDISVGGCYVETLVFISPGNKLTIEMKLPTGNWLRVMGEVMYYHPNIGFGMRFLGLTEPVLDVLANLVEYESIVE